ncbi:MAG: ribosome small subunit-dependent GTPase A [Clostridiales bacterium]|jgi:ribosome biogenesis GTPase|nr:ribosome small subunit-dependent GTPase A [Clostridiales bacterium]
MKKGIIVKALSGFFYVETEDGKIIECRARGKFRLEEKTPLVGDYVYIDNISDNTGTLAEILPRKNSFIRPPVANLDMMVIVASGTVPVTTPYLIDRIVAVAELRNCEPVICINKIDLDPGDELFDIYSATDIKTIRTSAKTGLGMDELSAVTAGKICAFTGNSGVGKSSILNALKPDFRLSTGEVSKKLGRGRHTTRHVELFSLDNGAKVADTPGFSSFNFDRDDELKPEELKFGFREFAPYLDTCRFRDCAHVKERGCSVINAVSEGKIKSSRHSSYVMMYEAAQEAEKNKYK